MPLAASASPTQAAPSRLRQIHSQAWPALLAVADHHRRRRTTPLAVSAAEASSTPSRPPLPPPRIRSNLPTVALADLAGPVLPPQLRPSPSRSLLNQLRLWETCSICPLLPSPPLPPTSPLPPPHLPPSLTSPRTNPSHRLLLPTRARPPRAQLAQGTGPTRMFGAPMPGAHPTQTLCLPLPSLRKHPSLHLEEPATLADGAHLECPPDCLQDPSPTRQLSLERLVDSAPRPRLRPTRSSVDGPAAQNPLPVPGLPSQSVAARISFRMSGSKLQIEDVENGEGFGIDEMLVDASRG